MLFSNFLAFSSPSWSLSCPFPLQATAGENETPDVKALASHEDGSARLLFIYLCMEQVLVGSREQGPVFDFTLMNITEPGAPARSLSNAIAWQSHAGMETRFNLPKVSAPLHHPDGIFMCLNVQVAGAEAKSPPGPACSSLQGPQPASLFYQEEKGHSRVVLRKGFLFPSPYHGSPKKQTTFDSFPPNPNPSMSYRAAP